MVHSGNTMGILFFYLKLLSFGGDRGKVNLYFSKAHMILLLLVFIRKIIDWLSKLLCQQHFQPDVPSPDAMLVLYQVEMCDCEHMYTQCLQEILQEIQGRFFLYLGVVLSCNTCQCLLIGWLLLACPCSTTGLVF